MTRKLFLIETDMKALADEVREADARLVGIYNIIEAFIEHEGGDRLTQILSVNSLKESDHVHTLYAKAEFGVESGWRLTQLSERKQITHEEYYALLLKDLKKMVEPKARIVFELEGMKFSLESNTERNYSVIQVDYADELTLSREEIFDNFSTIEVLGELYMSLEETFARLHGRERSNSTLQDAAHSFRAMV